MAFSAEEVPEDGGRRLEAVVFEPNLLGALEQEVLGLAGLRDAGEIALHIGGKNRNACL